MAQKGKVITAETLLLTDIDGAKKAIDEALANEKSNTWPKTYIVAGKVYTKLKQAGKDADGLKKSIEFYTKAVELDKKGDEKGKGIGKFEKELKIAFTFYRTDLTNAGVEGFNSEKFGDALTAFENVLKVNELEGSTNVDTVIIYNCALAAYNNKDWNKAEKYFKEAINNNYGGVDAVILLHQVYSTTGDSAKMEDNLKLGLVKYANDDRILTTLINFYLSAQQNDKATAYLNTAIQKDPTNPSFYYARAVLFDQSKKFEEAEVDYLKCISLDENYFNALYNLGVLYYNRAVENNNKANDLTDMKAFEKARAEADKTFEKSLPFMERAHIVNPKELAVLESLKNLYYRFENFDKYKEVQGKIKALEDEVQVKN